MQSFPHFVCLALRHHHAPVAVREQVQFTAEQLVAYLSDRMEIDENGDLVEGPIRELALLSTCNRVELYAAIDPEAHATDLLLTLVSELSGVNITDLLPHLDWYCSDQVVQHLAMVASGLDSAVIGEAQILGQLTSAYDAQVGKGAMGPYLDLLWQTAIRSGKRARRETRIGRNAASISSVAVERAGRLLRDYQDRTVLVVGAGKMARLCVTTVAARSPGRIRVANRTVEKAEKLLADFTKHDRAAIPLDELPEAVAQADVIFTATGAGSYMITEKMLQEALHRRNGAHIVLVDIAVPRDVEPSARALPGVDLVDVDDLHAALDHALATRRREIPKVEAIIEQELACFAAGLQQLTMRPVVVDLRQKAELIRRHELERTLRFIGEDVDPQTVDHIRHLTRALVNKLLHEPTVQLKAKAGDTQAALYADAARELFGLPRKQGVSQ